MARGAMKSIATGAASIVAQRVWILLATISVPKGAKERMTMLMVRLMVATNQVQLDMDFITQ